MTTKIISLDKFRAWLEGVEEMQAENWCPSIEQWTKIREKIDSIQDIPDHPIPRPTAAPMNGYQPPMPIPNQPQFNGESQFDQVPTKRAPRQQQMTTLPSEIHQPITDGVPTQLEPGSGPQDIDSSDGNYTTNFV